MERFMQVPWEGRFALTFILTPFFYFNCVYDERLFLNFLDFLKDAHISVSSGSCFFTNITVLLKERMECLEWHAAERQTAFTELYV